MKRLLIVLTACLAGCNDTSNTPSNVTRTQVDVVTNAEGLTVEQENIKKRLTTDNQPGSIKHLYVISAYSGQVLIYSTVQGKVTSSGKRLSPYSVVAGPSDKITDRWDGFNVNIHGESRPTSEVLQDDGTYGSSTPYLYWWDAQGKYHQHYVSGGQILHISDQPIAVNEIIINMELLAPNATTE